jgi:hypothetical protein
MDTVEEGDVPSAESEGRYAYVVTDLRQRRNGLSLLPPPNMYQQKFAPFLHKSPSKRDGLFYSNFLNITNRFLVWSYLCPIYCKYLIFFDFFIKYQAALFE